ncbi:hypothetical protein [Nostoc sp.]
MIGALNLDGLVAAMTVPESTNIVSNPWRGLANFGLTAIRCEILRYKLEHRILIVYQSITPNFYQSNYAPGLLRSES